ncbi:MAG: rubredoxin-like domain-containing protein [Nitrospinota bacterium]
MEAMQPWKCLSCGYRHEEPVPPAQCPACGAPRERFILPDRGEGLLERMVLTLHPHPIATHFPTALFPVSLLLFLLFVLRGTLHFERGAYYGVILGTLGTAAAVLTGFIDWRVRFKRATGVPVRRKQRLGFILLVVSLALSFWWTFLFPFFPSAVGIALNLAGLGLATVLVAALGYYGGKLVFGG